MCAKSLNKFLKSLNKQNAFFVPYTHPFYANFPLCFHHGLRCFYTCFFFRFLQKTNKQGALWHLFDTQ
jgi:hypothetical protein